MDRLLRMERLQSFFSVCGGEINGRKKVHKLVYLGQALGISLGQDFIFHHYGVYSPGLSNDLRQAENWGILTEEKTGVSYRYQLKEEYSGLNDEINSEKRRIIRTLNKRSPAVLEVLSTVIYLNKTGYPIEKIKDKTKEIKGHLESFFPDAITLANEFFGVEIR